MFLQLAQLRDTVAKLHNAVDLANYPATCLYAARLVPPSAILWAQRPPEDRDELAAWNRHALPLRTEIRVVLIALKSFLKATGRRGVECHTAWIDVVLVDLLRLLARRSDGGDYSDAPSLPFPLDGAGGEGASLMPTSDRRGGRNSPLPTPTPN